MSSRRSKKLKNLEKEVELIFSQDESNEDYSNNVTVNEVFLKTPSRTNGIENAVTPRGSTIVPEMLQTPRRSCRKSVKPTQDYEDIVNRSLRSGRKNLLATEDKKEENQDGDIIVAPKWTPAKVGRVSQKRSRKSRHTGKTTKGKKGNEVKQLDNETKFDKENRKTNEVIKVSKTENIAKEVIVENINKAEVNEISEITFEEVTTKNINQTENNKAHAEEITQQNKEVDEVVENMEHLNVETDSNNYQKDNNLKQEQLQNVDNMVTDLKSHNQFIQLINDDSEDSEFTEKSEVEQICIVYESNISSRTMKEEISEEIQTISPKFNAQIKIMENSFGSYLKSKDISLSDLGLNPLNDEEEKYDMEGGKHVKPSFKEDEEMPSLIICDDDEMENVKGSNKLNETFEANNSAEVVESLKNATQSEEVMETLQLSDDDGETLRKYPRVVLTDTELQDHLILSAPKELFNKKNVPSTPKALSTPPSASARKQPTKAFRFPTPYRIKPRFEFRNEVQETDTKRTPSKNISEACTISLTTLEPKDIVLRGIRKRSLSVCIDGNEQKRQKFLSGCRDKVNSDRTVSFYSPANETTIIDDLDIKIKISLQKEKSQEKNLVNKFVTTRRKRSMSFDDSLMSNALHSKLPRPVVNKNVSKAQTSTSKPVLRTKLPNFNAIHEKQFEKMESVVDHVNRKQERSKNLINSAIKLKPASSQKSVSMIKNTNKIRTEKPSALKRIDLGASSEKNKYLLKDTTVTPNKIEHHDSDTKRAIDLPDPRLNANKAIKSGKLSRRPPPQQQINKYLKPSQAANIENPRLNIKTVAPTKPRFNLSTSLIAKPTTSISSSVQNANKFDLSNYDDKMATRLQRHMDLFKGRVPATRAGAASRKNDVILKGVRSNRRFELQMQHRKNLEQ